jgi:predicted RNA-binding Zn-ribbon protein involved in translation (DUF1610 family)
MSVNRQKKKKKQKNQLCIIETEHIESQLLPELIERLDELAKEKKYVDIAVCPKCKSPFLRRVGSLSGDMFSHMGITPTEYECGECGWRGQLVLNATNKPTTIQDVVIINETNELADNKK